MIAFLTQSIKYLDAGVVRYADFKNLLHELRSTGGLLYRLNYCPCCGNKRVGKYKEVVEK